MERILILPGDPEFNLTLSTALPPDARQFCESHAEFAFVARAGSGLLEVVDSDDLDDYLLGGEYDERLSEIDEEDEIE